LEDNAFSDKRKYVNRWLLEWVQDSAVETLQLRAWIYFEYPDTNKSKVDIQWPELALGMWDKDTAGERANESNNLSKMDAILGGTGRATATKTSDSASQASFATNCGDPAASEDVNLVSETGSVKTEKELSQTRPGKSRRSSI